MSKIKIAALSLALLTAARFAAAPAHAQTVNANIDVNRAVDQVVAGLNTLINGNRDREAVVRLTIDKVFDGLGGHYNVMVFNYDQESAYNLNEQTTRDLSIPGGHYRLFVFKDGTFENKGDGTYLNWGFRGAYERSGRDNKFVTFSRIDDFVYPEVVQDGSTPGEVVPTTGDPTNDLTTPDPADPTEDLTTPAPTTPEVADPAPANDNTAADPDGR